ncbi:MAG: tRNA1(Val) (adenine(37)-N6)-methyltransferase [Defluviitaleaceae bacterium]|nr:tRNA1(Val) (adenine(37)-N6)-methyltransferase [Defluviitaleaceae bacterium]
MNIALKEGERLDDLHRNGYKIIQNPAKFCFGMDAALLSGFAKVHKGQRHLDLCSGNGVIPILLAAKTKGDSFWGIEIQKEMAEMANRSIALNSIGDKVKVMQGDIRDNILPAASFDVVTANPPYIEVGGGEQSPSGAKAIARHEIMCTLEDVIKAATRLLVSKGHFYMVHRPQRMAEIFVLFEKYGLAAKILRLVQSKVDTPPNLMLIAATRGGGRHLKMLAPLVIYGDDGKYTKEVYDIYYE